MWGAAGGAARPRIAPRGPGTAAGSAEPAGTSQRDPALSGAWGLPPGTSRSRPPRSSRGRCGSRCRDGGGSGAPSTGRHTASRLCPHASPPTLPVSHPHGVTFSPCHPPQCYPAPAVSPSPWVTRTARCGRAVPLGWAEGCGMRGYRGTRKDRMTQRTEGRGLPAPHCWG